MMATQKEANLFLKEFSQNDIIINHHYIDEGITMTYREIPQSVYKLANFIIIKVIKMI